MSSFYGNIKFNNQTPLIFDKIYSSRWDMEQNCKSDGIFNGRYILISYGDVRYTPYYKVDPMTQNVYENMVKSGYKYYIVDGTSTDGFSEAPINFMPGVDYYIKTQYSFDNTSTYAANKSNDELHYNHDYHNTVWQKIWTSTQSSPDITEKYIMVSHLNAETPVVSMIVDAPNDIMEFDQTNQVYFVVATDQHDLNIPGTITYDKFNESRSSLYIQDGVNEDGDIKYRKLTDEDVWRIDTVYYRRISQAVFNPVEDGRPFVNGMISEGLYNDLINNRNKSLFIEIHQALLDQSNLYNLIADDKKKAIDAIHKEADYDNKLKAIEQTYNEQLAKINDDADKEIADLNSNDNNYQQYVDQIREEANRKISEIQEDRELAKTELNNSYQKYQTRIDTVTKQYAERLSLINDYRNELQEYINNTNEDVKYVPAKHWDLLSHYYFMRYRVTEGRPHFDPIMSTDLEYRFHMPRNWKWDNNLDFDYNHAGFNHEIANYTNTHENKIYLTEQNSGDTYPVHRMDEPSAAVYTLADKEFYRNKITMAEKVYNEAEDRYQLALDESNEEIIIEARKERDIAKEKLEKATESLRIAQENAENYIIEKIEQPDTKHFIFDMKMLGDAVSNMWDVVYPRYYSNEGIETNRRNTFVGNDRAPNDPYNYPGTLAEAVRTLYFWLGIDSDNNFIQGPYRTDPEDPSSAINTVFGVINGAASLMGDFETVFSTELFIPVAGPYYPIDSKNYPNSGGYGHKISESGYKQLSQEEFDMLNNGGAGPLYIQNGEGQYDHTTDTSPQETTQYYRNMNSLLSMLREWQECLVNYQGDWTFDPDEDWVQANPISPRFIRNKPTILGIDKSDTPVETSINWFWKNYAI